uniref:Peptidase S1 domain-containing protein n=1 Tax=Panagrolaimus davidi TaxID=227884 RepID=A0A914PC68_9BILA
MSYCNITSSEAKDLIKTRICAGGKMQGTTEGDSGGPLLLVRNNRWIQFGITSYGFYTPAEKNDTATIFDRGVYTRVSAYCKWIETNTLGEVKCQ